MDSRSIESNHSLVDALAQLYLGGCQSRGVINRLPNEILRAILRRVPTHRLIRLRSVDKRWKLAIEDVCRDKKYLLILSARYAKGYFSQASRYLNGHFKFSHNFAVIPMECRLGLPGKQICTLLAELFPRIEQFFTSWQFQYFPAEFNSMLKQWSATLTTLSFECACIDNNTCAQLNELVNLKKLDILIPYSDGAAQQLAPTLARLEHFSGSKALAGSAMKYFGAEITSFTIYYAKMSLNDITHLRDKYAAFVSNLARFDLSTDSLQVLPIICEHFTSLQMLQISLFDSELSTIMIEDLARLVHLVDLRIDHFIIDLATLDVCKLVSLHNIQTFSLVNFRLDYPVEGRRARFSSHFRADERIFEPDLPLHFNFHYFCQVLNYICPNVHKLVIKSLDYKKFGYFLEFYVNFFTKLRSYDFDLNDPLSGLLD